MNQEQIVLLCSVFLLMAMNGFSQSDTMDENFDEFWEIHPFEITDEYIKEQKRIVKSKISLFRNHVRKEKIIEAIYDLATRFGDDFLLAELKTIDKEKCKFDESGNVVFGNWYISREENDGSRFSFFYISPSGEYEDNRLYFFHTKYVTKNKLVKVRFHKNKHVRRTTKIYEFIFDCLCCKLNETYTNKSLVWNVEPLRATKSHS